MAVLKVIDLSKWNIVSDWDLVKKEIDGVIIRCGFRSYSSGKLTIDPRFKNHIKSAAERNIPIGVYFFSQAINEIEAREEANYAINLVKEYKISIPIFIDIEYANNEHDGRADGLNRDQRTAVAAAFCNEVEKHGYKGGVYSSDSWYKSSLDQSKISKYKLWVARYSSNPPANVTGYIGWQYTDKGIIKGISGNVDISHWYESFVDTLSEEEAKIPTQCREIAETMKSFEGKNIYSQSNRWNIVSKGTGSGDCSSAVNTAYKNVLGVDIGVNTVAQMTDKDLYTVDLPINNGIPDEKKMLPGDLLYFRGTDSSRKSTGYVGHVEMYVGNGEISGHGGPSKGPTRKNMVSYCQRRQGTASPKVTPGNKGLICVRRSTKFKGVDVNQNVPTPPVTSNDPKYAAGTQVKLSNTPLYASATTNKVASRKTGTFYVWGGDVTNGRIRITNTKANIGKAGCITGWIDTNNIGTTSAVDPKPDDSKNLTKGAHVALRNVSFYPNSTSNKASAVRSGDYYIWDEKIMNNRIRITNDPKKAGKAGQVTAWIKVSDIK